MFLRILCLAAASVSLAFLMSLPDAISTLASDGMLASLYTELSLPLPTTGLIIACHGFGCEYRTEIRLTGADRTRLGAIMAIGRAAPVAERRAVAAAVSWFDRRVGPDAGTTHRVVRAGAHESRDRGQMDCIDISANNTSLFLVLDQLHLLYHHRVEPPVSRGIILDMRLPHTTAVLEEIKSGQDWAIDNWTHPYGELPDILPLEQWKSGRD